MHTMPAEPRNIGGPGARSRQALELHRNTAMTLEIIHLTTQIQNWLNIQVARHLAAQAARLNH